MQSKPRRLSVRHQLNKKELHVASLGSEILRRTRLPCKLVFSENDIHAEARHVQLKGRCCYVIINSHASISVPEHIILHEAAHHGQKSGKESHGPEWANRLLQLYKQTGISLPRATKFESFAKLCDLAIRRTS